MIAVRVRVAGVIGAGATGRSGPSETTGPPRPADPRTATRAGCTAARPHSDQPKVSRSVLEARTCIAGVGGRPARRVRPGCSSLLGRTSGEGHRGFNGGTDDLGVAARVDQRGVRVVLDEGDLGRLGVSVVLVVHLGRPGLRRYVRPRTTKAPRARHLGASALEDQSPEPHPTPGARHLPSRRSYCV